MQNTRLVSCKKRGFSIFMKTEVHIDMDGFLRSSLLTHRMTLQISLHPIRGTLLLRVNDKCIPLDQICYIFSPPAKTTGGSSCRDTGADIQVDARD